MMKTLQSNESIFQNQVASIGMKRTQQIQYRPIMAGRSAGLMGLLVAFTILSLHATPVWAGKSAAASAQDKQKTPHSAASVKQATSVSQQLSNKKKQTTKTSQSNQKSQVNTAQTKAGTKQANSAAQPPVFNRSQIMNRSALRTPPLLRLRPSKLRGIPRSSAPRTNELTSFGKSTSQFGAALRGTPSDDPLAAVQPGTSNQNDDPGVGENDPTEGGYPGKGLNNLIEVTGAVDPVEMGGLETPSNDNLELRDCVRGECDDGKVATVAPTGDPKNPDGGWTDPPRDDGGGEPSKGDLDLCAVNPATCETGDRGETQKREDATTDDDCDDDDEDGRCSQYSGSGKDSGKGSKDTGIAGSGGDSSDSDTEDSGRKTQPKSQGTPHYGGIGICDGTGVDDLGTCHQYGATGAGPDSDGDGWADKKEIKLGSDPKDAYSTGDDLDADWLSNDVEIETSPTNPDSDNDGLKDGREVLWLGTIPNNPDSDEDGWWDSLEIRHGTDPLDNTSCPYNRCLTEK